MSEQDPYAVLGVPRHATEKEIRKAYISRCKVLHPDRFDPKTQAKEWAQANEMHAELNRAYATLRNASQQSESDAQAAGAKTSHSQATSPNSTPGTPPAPHRPKRPFIDGRVFLGLIFAGLWGLYSGATSLWRESGIDKVPHHLSLTELRYGTVPNNRLLRVSDAECDLGHGVAYLEHSTPQAYYIPLVASSVRLESETPTPGRRIILRLTKKLFDAHSGALQNAGAPLTFEGIRLLNTDIESRIEGFLKKELGIASLDNVVVIDGGRQPIGSLLPIKVLIISSVWLLMLFFNFVMRRPKLTWSAIAVLCGAFAIVPDRLSIEPEYKSPLGLKATNTRAIHGQRESKSDASARREPGAPHAITSQDPPTKPAGDQSEIDLDPIKLRKAAEQGDAPAQFRLGLELFSGLRVPQDFAESAIWYRKAAEGGEAHAENALGDSYTYGWGVPKDSAEAVIWYSKAAEHGSIDAIRTLGFYYGSGVSKNISEAVRWFRKGSCGNGVGF